MSPWFRKKPAKEQPQSKADEEAQRWIEAGIRSTQRRAEGVEDAEVWKALIQEGSGEAVAPESASEMARVLQDASRIVDMIEQGRTNEEMATYMTNRSPSLSPEKALSLIQEVRQMLGR